MPATATGVGNAGWPTSVTTPTGDTSEPGPSDNEPGTTATADLGDVASGTASSTGAQATSGTDAGRSTTSKPATAGATPTATGDIETTAHFADDPDQLPIDQAAVVTSKIMPITNPTPPATNPTATPSTPTTPSTPATPTSDQRPASTGAPARSRLALGSDDDTFTTGPVSAMAEQSGLFYGWILVGAVFFILAITSGIGFYNASVILAAATSELDASVGSVSGATGLFFAISGLTGYAFSKQLDSVDLRWFFALGGLVGAIALVGLQWVDSVPKLYLFFALFGVGFALAGLVPSTTLVTRWFDRRRAVALSVASTGLSVGGIAVTPISSWLITNRQLSGASPYLAAIWIIGIIPIAMLLIRSFPSEKGLQPDGLPLDARQATDTGHNHITDTKHITESGRAPGGTHLAAETEQEPTARRSDRGESLKGLDYLSARRTRFFIALCFAYAVIFFGQVGGIAQLFKMVQERTDTASATTALSVLAFSSVVARLVGGTVVIKVSTQLFTAALAVAQAAALILLALAPSSLTLILSAAFFGVSIGNLLMLQPLLLAEAFGVRNYGRIYSFNQLFGTIGVAGGPLGLGVLRDAFDYEAAFLVAALASFIGFLFIISAGPMARVQQRWA